MDLRLPGIEPARPAPSAAGAIDRAGAQFKDATDAVSGLMYETELADIAVQTQEATLNVQKGLNDALDEIKSGTYFTPAEVKAKFGGNVPADVKLEEEDGTPRAVIPIHEIARPLFEERAQKVAAAASGNIKASGWRAKFQQAAEADVERARTEAYSWQRAQRLADNEIRSVSQYQQAVARRDWNTAGVILNGPGMSLETREKLVADYPQMRTESELQDRIRSAQTPEELDAVLADIAGNAVKSEEAPDAPFYAPLDSAAQWKFTATARERQSQIIAGQAAAAKREYDTGREAIGQKIEAAVARAEAEGLPAFTFYSAAELLADERKLPQGLKEEDYNSFLSHLRTASDDSRSRGPSEQGWAMYTKFAGMEPNKGLKGIPITDIYNARADLGSKFSEVMGWWRAAQEQGSNDAAQKPVVRPEVKDWIDLFLVGTLKRDPPGKNEAAANQRLTDLGRAIDAVRGWEEREQKAIDPSNLATLLSRTFNDDNDKNNDRAIRVLNAELPKITGRALVTQQDLDEALTHITEQTPIVDRAYEALITSRPLDSGFRAEVYALTQNAVVRPLLEAKLQSEGTAVNPNTLAWAAVKALQPPQDKAYEQDRAAKAEREARSRDVESAGKAQAAEKEAVRGALERGQTAAEKAERERWRSLPTWEQEAETLTKTVLEDDATAVERNVRATVMAEDRAAQVAAAKGKGPFGRDAAIMGEWPAGHPRRTALEERIKAESSALLVQHQARIEAQMDDAKGEYRRFVERVEAKEPAAVKQYQELYLDSFPKWFQMRREGKVQ